MRPESGPDHGGHTPFANRPGKVRKPGKIVLRSARRVGHHDHPNHDQDGDHRRQGSASVGVPADK